MKSLDIRTIQNWLNQTQIIYLPDFSEILDISFDEWGGNLDILYQFDYQLAGTNQKMFNIWIMDSKNICPPPSDLYKFFGSVEKKYSGKTQVGTKPKHNTKLKTEICPPSRVARS